MSRSLFLLALGSLIAVTISFIKLNQHRKREKRKKDKKDKRDKDNKIKEQKPFTPNPQINPYPQLQLKIGQKSQTGRQLYQNQICQPRPYQLIIQKPQFVPQIAHLHYTIALNLNKSKRYEGSVIIKIINTKTKDHSLTSDLLISYAGTSVLCLIVNGHRVEEGDVIFNRHTITVEKKLLAKDENVIEVIFSNKYAFMGDGLTCYFPLDQANKYSLKGQVIYARNGIYKASRIIPCLNVLNPCDVVLQVLHPNGFIAESNSNKMLAKMVSRKDYPLYPFFFQFSNNSLNTSRRLNNSSTSETSIRSSEEIIKVKSEFAPFKLNSIHDFFVFCSAVVEVRPLRSMNSSSLSLARRRSQEQSRQMMKEVLIRYFTKDHLLKKATSCLNMLESQISQILTKIAQHSLKNPSHRLYQGKIDIFFIDDVKAQGDFHIGSILLCQSTIERGIVDRRIQFLVGRALIGMGYLMKKSRNLETMEAIMRLNQLVLEILPECEDYIFMKNIEYGTIRAHFIEQEERRQKDKSKNNDPNCKLEWILQYYEKQCRYLVKNMEKLQQKVSANVSTIARNLIQMDTDQYWTYFIARHPFIEPNVAQIMIKLGLKHKGPPTRDHQLHYAKQNFVKSKYYIQFFTVRQLQKTLKTHLQLKSANLHKYLPVIRIKQSCLPLIPAHLQPYLPAHQNLIDCYKLYEQFKKFHEYNNFHHVSALRREVKRIKLFMKGRQREGEGLKRERIDIGCSLEAWRLLAKLALYPMEEDWYRIISELEGYAHGDEDQRQAGGLEDIKMKNFNSQKIQAMQEKAKLEEEVKEIERLLQQQIQTIK